LSASRRRAAGSAGTDRAPRAEKRYRQNPAGGAAISYLVCNCRQASRLRQQSDEGVDIAEVHLAVQIDVAVGI